MSSDPATALPEGSLRSSHRETNPVRRKPAPKAVQQQALALVERCCASGTHIRQQLDVERMKHPLQKGVFYVAETESPAEPGFLVFLPGTAPVFLQMKKHSFPPCTLRMRVSPLVSEGGGSVLVATLDVIHHTLRIEDVWMWRGQRLFDVESYTQRREHLREFVERLWVPDTRLMGGITTTVLNPTSLATFLERGPSQTTTIVEFIPELPGKRRVWMSVDGRRAQQGQPQRPTAARVEGVVPSPPIGVAAPTPVVVPQPVLKRKARAVAVEKMPDIYDLYDEQGFPISRASVQLFSVSQQLRAATASPSGAWVQIRWRPEFGGYEIESIATP